jgi:hypothetical protein
MTKYYFSGVDRAKFIEILDKEHAAGMVNANVATQPAMKEAYHRFPDVHLTLDSGAFQGNDCPQAYAKIVSEVGWRFDWVSNLDVIGDQEKSDHNWLRLRDYGVSALWVYQVKGGAELAILHDRAVAHNLIGVGGLVPIIKRDANEALRLIESIGKILQLHKSRAHFFGVGSPLILAEFCNEPWFNSADSQSWLCGVKARELITRSGRRIKSQIAGLQLSRHECASQNIRQINGWLESKHIQLPLLA